ncbi:MAG TPA: hypothetical protein VJT82_13135 [Pyrinomonadaceae bacterium]|nr:hypothetical protein [Pyrinomonadaceae bacterium]
MTKCPYCERPLPGLGLRCRACRRYVLGWPHVLLLSMMALISLAVLLELLLSID